MIRDDDRIFLGCKDAACNDGKVLFTISPKEINLYKKLMDSRKMREKSDLVQFLFGMNKRSAGFMIRSGQSARILSAGGGLSLTGNTIRGKKFLNFTDDRDGRVKIASFIGSGHEWEECDTILHLRNAIAEEIEATDPQVYSKRSTSPQL